MGEGRLVPGEGTGGPDGGGLVRTPAACLHIPADPGRLIAVKVVRLTAVDLSDAIGGGFLDDAVSGMYEGDGFTFYVDEHRVAKGLPANERAAALAVQLGQEGHELLADLRGDVLVLGCDERLDDVSVPAQVIDAARQSGIVVMSTDENR